MPKQILPWLIYPPAPKLDLSKAKRQGLVRNARGIRLWHAVFGAPLDQTLRAGRTPVLMMHGGVSSSEYSAPQVDFLTAGPENKDRTVIVVDLPGHGRSPFDDRELTYSKLADDIAGFLDALSIPKVAIVSWSEGTMVGWSLLAYGHHSRVERAFLYSVLDDYRNADAERVMGIPMVGEYFTRSQREWEEAHPGQSWDDFLGAWMKMWVREPIWTAETFRHIPVRGETPDAPIIWVVTGDHDDWIPPETHDRVATYIRNSSYLKMPSAGHLTFIQNVPMYNRFVQCFLEDIDVADSPKASL